jgi:hypothetical protein
MKTAPLRIFVEIPPEFVSQAKYALAFLSASWGLRAEVIQDPGKRASCTLVYSSRQPVLRVEEQLAIPFDGVLYDPSTPCRTGEMDGRPIWMREGVVTGEADLIGATFRLLTLADESQVPARARDDCGDFLISGLPKERAESAGVPLADHHARILLERVLAHSPGLRERLLPRWPHGKTYAVCLSHDTDAVHIGHPWEMAAAMAKWITRRKKIYWEMIRSGLAHLHIPADNPYWGFPCWREYESSRDIRSCFYLAVPPRKCGRHLHDCRSTVFDGWVDWDPLRTMRDEGWEFGLHAAIRARSDPEEIALEKLAIEERLGTRIGGLRHHYLAIDHTDPSTTFRSHAGAGFIYDSSVGWKRCPGFRAGTSLPYEPYDPRSKGPIPLIEIPLCLMDNYVLTGAAGAASEKGASVVSAVSNAGGVVTLNWHTETFKVQVEFEEYQKALEGILGPILSDRDAWFATPIEVARWWRDRTESLRCEE